MKFINLFLLISVALFSSAQAQPPNGIVKRKIQFHTLGKDSINLSLNEHYELIEDSCAQIIRYGHFDFKTRKFHGSVKDVSKLNPNLVVSEGNYTDDGLKNGVFTSYHLNGKLESKGNYKNDKYDGHWAFFNENDKPILTFEADNGNIKIIDAWNESGKKYIDNGKGNYVVKTDYLTWKGKLEDGKPEGTWHAFKTDDATETSLVDEHFKKGIFIKGNSPVGDYTDASRIILISPDLLPYTKGEKMQMSLIACNGTGFKHIVNAQYYNGIENFSDKIKQAVSPLFTTTNIASYEHELLITGDISPKGNLELLVSHQAFNDAFAQRIINRLYTLPSLQPATVDGKPVVQQFSIKFTFHLGSYNFSYNFLAIKQNI